MYYTEKEEFMQPLLNIFTFQNQIYDAKFQLIYLILLQFVIFDLIFFPLLLNVGPLLLKAGPLLLRVGPLLFNAGPLLLNVGHNF